MQNNLQEKALNRCYFFLKFRPRSEKEIRDFLYKKVKKYKLNKNLIQKLIDALKSKGYIDDKKFIEWFVSRNLNKKIKAVFIIKNELKIHGIKNDLIEEYFNSNVINEQALVKQLLEKYQQRWTNLDIQERRIKIVNALLRKGFNYELIKEAIEDSEKKY